MKTLIVLALLATSLTARAANPTAERLTNAQPVKLVVPYSLKCSSTTVGTVQADLSGNTSSPLTTGGISRIIVQNLSSGTTIYVSSDPNVTTSTANATGFAIYPITTSNPALPNDKEFPISTTQQFFGVAGTNLTPIGVCKIR